MMDDGSDLNHRIAGRIAELRSASGLSLAALATRSGVSRSMISLIERGESSPTAIVLDKLATGLGVTLASLFDINSPPNGQPEVVSRRDKQVEWQDPGSGYVRRNVSPVGIPHPVRIVEVRFPAGARVAFESAPQPPTVHQQVWVLEGKIEVRVGSVLHELREGDCLAMKLDQPIMFHNPTAAPTRYAVVITTEHLAR